MNNVKDLSVGGTAPPPLQRHVTIASIFFVQTDILTRFATDIDG